MNIWRAQAEPYQRACHSSVLIKPSFHTDPQMDANFNIYNLFHKKVNCMEWSRHMGIYKHSSACAQVPCKWLDTESENAGGQGQSPTLPHISNQLNT